MMHQVKPKVFCVTKIDSNAPQANILKSQYGDSKGQNWQWVVS